MDDDIVSFSNVVYYAIPYPRWIANNMKPDDVTTLQDVCKCTEDKSVEKKPCCIVREKLVNFAMKLGVHYLIWLGVVLLATSPLGKGLKIENWLNFVDYKFVIALSSGVFFVCGLGVLYDYARERVKIELKNFDPFLSEASSLYTSISAIVLSFPVYNFMNNFDSSNTPWDAFAICVILGAILTNSGCPARD